MQFPQPVAPSDTSLVAFYLFSHNLAYQGAQEGRRGWHAYTSEGEWSPGKAAKAYLYRELKTQMVPVRGDEY